MAAATALLACRASETDTAPAPLVTDGPVRAIAVATDGTIYIGGGFTHAGATTGSMVPRNHLAAIDSTGALTSWDPDADNNVNALAVSGTTVYVGGDFTKVGGQNRNGIAALDATGSATAWNPDAPSGAVAALAVSGSTVYAGGNFTIIGGQPRKNLAALDSTGAATAWNPGAGGGIYVSTPVSAIAVSGGTIYVGGSFTSAGGELRNNAVALDSAGAATAWNPNTDGPVYSLAVGGSRIVVGGNFTNISSRQLPYLAILAP